MDRMCTVDREHHGYLWMYTVDRVYHDRYVEVHSGYAAPWILCEFSE